MVGFLNPQKVLEELELFKTMVIAEFGCGSGSFTLLLAKRLPEGKVYGLDIQEEPLSALVGRARAEGLRNIETICCDLEQEGGSSLPADFVDVVLLPNALFQAESKRAMLQEAARILRRGGQMLIVDWKKEAPLGPREGRIGSEEVKDLAEILRLKLKKEFEAGAFHYGLVFEKA